MVHKQVTDLEKLFNTVFNDVGIGFEPLQRSVATTRKTSYPPHNLVKLTDDKFVLSLAVAGFTDDNIDITVDNNKLVIKGETLDSDDNIDYLYRGIASRNFTKSFVLGEHMEVKGAGIKDGMLHISIERCVPEELKPRKIPLLKTKEVQRMLES